MINNEATNKIESPKNQLLENQLEQLIHELYLITSDKWRRLNQDGEILIRKIFNKFEDLFESDEVSELNDKIDYNNLLGLFFKL